MGTTGTQVSDYLADAFVVMPNHVHGIVFLGARERTEQPGTPTEGGHAGPRLPTILEADSSSSNDVAADLCVGPDFSNDRLGKEPTIGDLVDGSRR